jgi:hypothetical protein
MLPDPKQFGPTFEEYRDFAVRCGCMAYPPIPGEEDDRNWSWKILPLVDDGNLVLWYGGLNVLLAWEVVDAYDRSLGIHYPRNI